MSESGSSESPSASLRRHEIRPRKRLGQNFLRDSRYVDRVLEAADVGTEDEVLEIGAGTGVLTRAVASRAGRLLAIELDDRLAAVLREEFRGTPNVEIWHGNALDFDPCRHFQGQYKLV